MQRTGDALAMLRAQAAIDDDSTVRGGETIFFSKNKIQNYRKTIPASITIHMEGNRSKTL